MLRTLKTIKKWKIVKLLFSQFGTYINITLVENNIIIYPDIEIYENPN